MRHLRGRFRQEGRKDPCIRFWRGFCIVAGEHGSTYINLTGMPFPTTKRAQTQLSTNSILAAHQ